MAIFNSYVSLPEGKTLNPGLDQQKVLKNPYGLHDRHVRHKFFEHVWGNQNSDTINDTHW